MDKYIYTIIAKPIHQNWFYFNPKDCTFKRISIKYHSFAQALVEISQGNTKIINSKLPSNQSFHLNQQWLTKVLTQCFKSCVKASVTRTILAFDAGTSTKMNWFDQVMRKTWRMKMDWSDKWTTITRSSAVSHLSTVDNCEQL